MGTQQVDRRTFLRAGAIGAAAVALPACTTPTGPPPTSLWSCGVASGLHSHTEVVIWTRVDPLLGGGITSVDWEVATEPGFGSVVASGTAPVTPATDRTVKLLVGGLEPDRDHWYRFVAGGSNSPVGRARTAPVPGAAATSLTLAYSSCQNFANGWYSAWRELAARPVDAVLFLGDYIYEAGAVQLLGTVRSEPFATVTTLEGYRSKYRLYRSDPDLQAVHAAHPFLTVWDDHEFTNDWDRTTLLEQPARAAAAFRAWFEYQPVWPTAGTRIHRDLVWGDLGHLVALDTRQYRDAHREDTLVAGVAPLTTFETDPTRTLLGTEQRDWLVDTLVGSDATWRIVGNQVLMAPLRTLDLDDGSASIPHAGLYSGTAFDTWDGFQAERDHILGALAANGVQNTVVLTGDYHSFWQSSIRSDFDDESTPIVVNEFAAGAVSSAGGAANENLLFGDAANGTFAPAFNYVDGFSNGYGLLEATHDELRVTFLEHEARYSQMLPEPAVRFTLAAGDPIPVTEVP